MGIPTPSPGSSPSEPESGLGSSEDSTRAPCFPPPPFIRTSPPDVAVGRYHGDPWPGGPSPAAQRACGCRDEVSCVLLASAHSLPPGGGGRKPPMQNLTGGRTPQTPQPLPRDLGLCQARPGPPAIPALGPVTTERDVRARPGGANAPPLISRLWAPAPPARPAQQQLDGTVHAGRKGVLPKAQLSASCCVGPIRPGQSAP